MSRPGVQSPLYVVGEATHPGETGKNNEDSYGYITIPVSNNRTGQLTLAIVADGIGGQAGGEEAAQLAVQVVRDYFAGLSSAATTPRANTARAASANLPAMLSQALWDANQTIYKRSRERAMFTDMGSTATVALISDDDLYVANVGDSRVYLITEDAVTQLTIDHSWGQEAVEAGRITAEEARAHPNRNVLKRYLGITPEVEVDLRVRIPGAPLDAPDHYRQSPVPIHTGDTVLLCSDGLTDLVSDGELAAIVRKNRPQQAADHLVALARRRGGHDNITVLILRSGEPITAERLGLRGAKERRVPALAWGIGALIVVAALLSLLMSVMLRMDANKGASANGVIPLPTVNLQTRTLSSSPTPPRDAEAVGVTEAATDPGDVEMEDTGSGPDLTADASIFLPALDTATPVRTRTPVPTPTHTPVPTQGIIVRLTTASTTVAPALPGAVPVAPTLAAPGNNENVHGSVTFSWQPAGPLPAGTAYEVVWWNPQENADAAARAFAATTTASTLTVDLDHLWDANRTVDWTVLIVQPQPYHRLTQPSNSPVWRLNYNNNRCTNRRVCDKIPCIDPITGRPTTCETNCRTVCN
jgi:serine/threonine protein phosphatase PrpC